MDSVDSSIRELVTKELHEIRPIYASGVETAEAMGSYDQNFYAKSIKAMQTYQRQHRRIFCKACIEPDDKKGRLIYRRLCIELNNDLLGNDEKHVQLRCFKCDFDMFVAATPELMITDRISDEDWHRLRGAMVAACDAGIPPERLHHDIMQVAQQRSMERSRQDMDQYRQSQQMMPGQAGSFARGAAGSPQSLASQSAQSADYRHQLDSMRYMAEQGSITKQKYMEMFDRDVFKSLSSAPTSQAKKKKK